MTRSSSCSRQWTTQPLKHLNYDVAWARANWCWCGNKMMVESAAGAWLEVGQRVIMYLNDAFYNLLHVIRVWWCESSWPCFLLLFFMVKYHSLSQLKSISLFLYLIITDSYTMEAGLSAQFVHAVPYTIFNTNLIVIILFPLHSHQHHPNSTTHLFQGKFTASN